MNGLRPVYLVARRELRERVRTRGFQVATALTLLGVLAIVAVTAINSGDEHRTVTVAALGAQAQAALAEVEGEHESLELTIQSSDRDYDEEAARQALLDGDLDAALVDNRILVGEEAPDTLAAVLARAQVELVSDDSGEDEGAGIALLVTLLMYMAIFSAGYTVSSGVVEEKTSRVVELILGAVKPAQLLAGKVLGIGLVSLIQFGLIVLVGVLAATLSGSIDLPDTTFSAAAVAFLFFVLGYVFYACAFATAGAIVSRQEDSQTSTTPLVVLLTGGYLASFSVIDDPDSTLAVLLSFVPPVAPMIVSVRAASGALPPEQLILAIVAMLAGCAALIWAAGRIYERAILRMGAPLEIREVLGLLRR